MNREKLETVIELLLSEPFMNICDGNPDYHIEFEKGPPGYSQVLCSLFLENIRPDVIQSFNSDYNSLAKPFETWALQNNFVSSQILESEDSRSLVFEITGII